MSNDEFLWSQKYRPHTIDDCILPEADKKIFREFVKKKDIPNLLLSGGPGVGKTTVAMAMLDELDCDYMMINGSMKGNIDTLRNDIANYASSVSFSGGRKYVILDEADYLNPNSTQPALRNFMEEFSRNCGFILTVNYKNRIIDPLQSRCSIVEFKVPKIEKKEIVTQFLKRMVFILKEEKITLENNDITPVVELTKKYFPDFRKIISELQRYSATGQIDSGLLVNLSDESFDSLVSFLKERKFTEMRKWVADNLDTDLNVICEQLYLKMDDKLEPSSMPQLVYHLANYDYKNSFVVNPEINLVAMLTEIMRDCEFK